MTHNNQKVITPIEVCGRYVLSLFCEYVFEWRQNQMEKNYQGESDVEGRSRLAALRNTTDSKTLF